MAFNWSTLNEFPFTKNYDDDLREMLYKMKELLENYNTILNGFNELKNNFTELQNDFDILENTVNTDMQQLRTEFSELEQVMDDLSKQFELVKSIVENLQIEFNNYSKLIDAKIDKNNLIIFEMLAQQKTYFENEIKRLEEIINQIGRHDIFNRLEGRVMAIGNVVQDYFEGLRTHALTNAEFSELGLTNNEFAAFRITNRQFITEGKDWLNYFWRFTGINPLTGFKTRESNVNSFLWAEMLGSISNSEWIALDLTNDDYDALNLTNAERCYYNRHPSIGAGYVRYSNNGTGLSNSQYEKLELTE